MAEKAIRFGVSGKSAGMRAATWKVWSPSNKEDVYIAARELAGALKLSLHESGAWHLACKLWTFGSAPFPLANGAIIQSHIEQSDTDMAIAFAIHVRRFLDNRCVTKLFPLDEPFRHWSPVAGLTKVDALRDALNRIIHATEFTVGFERLPDNVAKIVGGAIGVIYLRTRTDQREEALIDAFAMASCFFRQVLPVLRP